MSDHFEIQPRWPNHAGNGPVARELTELVGATIVKIGTPLGLGLEGGGLAIEFIPKGELTSRTFLFEFNELGLWLFSPDGDHVTTTEIGK